MKDGARVLDGPLQRWKVFGRPDGGLDTIGWHYGLPRFAKASFSWGFPFGACKLEDKGLPVDVSVEGWSPFVPLDADSSSMPVAGVEYTFRNKTSKPLDMAYSFHALNFMQVKPRKDEPRLDSVKPTASKNGFILFQVAAKGRPWEQGAFCAELDGASSDCQLFRGGWFDPLTMIWKAVSSGDLRSSAGYKEGDPSPGGSLYLAMKLKPGELRTLKLRLSWHVPSSDLRHGYEDDGKPSGTIPAEEHASCGREFYRPWYSRCFKDAGAVSRFWAKEYDRLRKESRQFSGCLYDSSLPKELMEAVSANLHILKSPTVLRQTDGRLWLWEGCGDKEGCCAGSCTHVWNYQQAISNLFPELERGLRQTEFNENQDSRGHQLFRAALPVRDQGRHDFHAAADGQLGGIMKLYREWRISGDAKWLRSMWQNAKRSLDYCIELWDPDGKGLLVEPHHNTYDIEFWGADPMCASIYLGALLAASKMMSALGEDSSRYDKLYARGVKAFEKELWNGEYFKQSVDWKGMRAGTPEKFATLAGGAYSKEAMALLRKEGPKYQYGAGCLSDGVIGLWMADIYGLGDIIDRRKAAAHLNSVFQHNFKPDLSLHANPQRPGYALGKEGGLLLCTWPKGDALSLPFPYSDEVWTGIEYQVASHLMRMGMFEKGMKIVKAVRKRYGGSVRNPFNEYECGHFYGRAMASYALLQGATGARYDAVSKVMTLAPSVKGDFKAFICTVTGYGPVGIKSGKPFLDVKSGRIDVRKWEFQPFKAKA